MSWPFISTKSSFKIMDPVSVALPQNLPRIFVATLAPGLVVLVSVCTQLMLSSFMTVIGILRWIFRLWTELTELVRKSKAVYSDF